MQALSIFQHKQMWSALIIWEQSSQRRSHSQTMDTAARFPALKTTTLSLIQHFFTGTQRSPLLFHWSLLLENSNWKRCTSGENKSDIFPLYLFFNLIAHLNHTCYLNLTRSFPCNRKEAKTKNKTKKVTLKLLNAFTSHMLYFVFLNIINKRTLNQLL